MHTNSVDSHGFGENFAYATRWRLDLSTPPLRIAIASPVESTSVREWGRYHGHTNRECRLHARGLANSVRSAAVHNGVCTKLP